MAQSELLGTMALPDKVWDDRKASVAAALEQGCLTNKEICDMTSLKIYQLNGVFKKFPELKVAHKMVAQDVGAQAVSNLAEIIMDTDHPKNFEASKLFITRFRTEMDETQERQDGDSVNVDFSKGESTGRLNISFTAEKTEENNDN